MPAQLSDEEYDNRICVGYGYASPAEMMADKNGPYATALAASRNDPAAALRSLEVKKEKWQSVDGWFIAAVPDWNFKEQKLSGKTTIYALVSINGEGHVVSRRIQGEVNPNWKPIETKLAVGPISRSTYLLKDEDDPKRVKLNDKDVQFRENNHDAPLPDSAVPGAKAAIEWASELQTKGRVVMRGKAKNVFLIGHVTDDPSQIVYREGGDFAENLTVPVITGDGAVVQIKFDAGKSVYTPDWLAKVAGISKGEDEFQSTLPNRTVISFGQLGIGMPFEPLKGENAKSPAEVEQYLDAFRERNWLRKETNQETGVTRERLDLKGQFEEDEEGNVILVDENGNRTTDVKKGKKVPLKTVVFCGQEIFDLGFEERDGEEVPVGQLRMTDRPGKYPWFAVNPGTPSENQPDRPANNHGAFILFPEFEMAGEVEIERNDAAKAAADRWAKYTQA